MPFRGYFRLGDPRGPLFASAGATWPTVPPWRYRLGSENATGSWDFLKTTGILLEADGNSGHDKATWRGIADEPSCFQKLEFTRVWLPLTSLIRWKLLIKTPCQDSPWTCIKTTSPGAANTDLPLGGLFTPNGPPGEPGTALTMYQVEFDELLPPTGWPPW